MKSQSTCSEITAFIADCTVTIVSVDETFYRSVFDVVCNQLSSYGANREIRGVV